MVGRKRKYLHPRNFTGYVDEKDLEFLDDHRGKIGRMPFLIECLHATKGNHDKMRITDSEISRLKAENHELKRQLMFEQSRNQKQTKVVGTLPDLLQNSELIKFYHEKNLTKSINELGSSVNWQNIYDKNIRFLSQFLKDPKELEKLCLELLRKERNYNNL